MTQMQKVFLILKKRKMTKYKNLQIAEAYMDAKCPPAGFLLPLERIVMS